MNQAWVVKLRWLRPPIVAIIAVGLGFLTREGIYAASGLRLPYLAFVPWVIAASLLGGITGGILSIAGFAAIAVTALEPTTMVRTSSPIHGLVIFIILSLLVAAVSSWAQRLHRRATQSAAVLRQSEERLRVALEAGRMGTWEWTIATGVVRWSSTVEEIHGRIKGSFKGTFEDVLSDVVAEDREKVSSAVQQALATLADYRVEYRIRTSAGEERWLEARGRVICDEASKPIRMMGVCMDISDRKRGEQALVEREQQMRLITDALPALISYVDRDQRYLFASKAYEQWLCRPRHQIIGKQIAEIVPSAQSYEIIRPHVEQVLAGIPAHFSSRMTYPDGITREVDVTYSPDLLPDGQVAGFAVLVIDVSDRRRSEDALRASESRYRALADAVPDFVWSCSADGRVEYLNHRYVEYTGVTLETVNTGGWHEVVHPDDHAPVEQAWIQSLQTGEPFELEYRFRRRGQREYRWFLTRTVPVRGTGGEVVRWVGAATDVHDSKMAREERGRLLEAERCAREEAERAGRIKDQFLAVLSHELRTPLAPVLMTVSLIETNPELPESLREDIAMIRRSVELEARLIDDLLDLTRVARGKIRYDFQTVDLHLLIRSAISICCSDGKNDLSVDLAAEESYIHGDPARLQQVFWNLLNNAWKFTPPGGKISISTRNENGRTIIRVTDNGAGIESELLPRVFDAFEQGDVIRARRFGGLGLGLAICKALVSAHGGTISAASDGKDRGATFTVDLPTSAAPIHHVKPAPGNGARDDGQPRLRMLLVEDHPHTLRALTKLLSSIGHQVDGVMSVTDGLRLAESSPYDLIISDLGLPDGTGFELMRQLRQRYGLRGIALSGYGMEDDLERSRAAGFTEHLVKPVDLQKLRDAIARVTAAVPPLKAENAPPALPEKA